MKNGHSEEDLLPTDSLKRYNRFLKLPCRVLRRHVFHGVKEDEKTQTIECLSCGDSYTLHKEGRNRIENSLWDCYQMQKDVIDLSPPPAKRPKKRWDPKYIFLRR